MRVYLLNSLLFFSYFWMHSQNSAMISRLETFDITTNERSLIREENSHFEAPNWSADGHYFIINQDGLLYNISGNGKKKEVIPSGFAKQCNNDHGISADGAFLAISNNDIQPGTTGGTSRIYVLPIQGGTPRLVTNKMPSYWHGWSPDGKKIVYTALRNDAYDIYQISLNDTTEVQLTNAPGLDDGPEYSPDGKFIYYNSFQSGVMELWRMRSDGSEKAQLTDDAYSNWFPHPSPDGKHLVFISYLEDQGQNHPALKNVAIRLYNLKDKSIQTLCSFTGGQGTINVPSWSPDSKKFAFVSYQNNE